MIGLSDGAQANSVEYALLILKEHARLHGWSQEVGGGIHPLVTELAQCPPAALAELSRVDRSNLRGKQIEAIDFVARALAENGHVGRAVAILADRTADQDSEQVADRALWQSARLLEAAKQWQSTLDYLQKLDATQRFSELAINRVRAHCYFELGQITELENLLFANLTSDPSCHSLELLLQAWRLSGSTRGLPQLLEGCLQTVHDLSAAERIRTEITGRFEVAEQHLQILSLSAIETVEHLSELLAGGDHHREAQLTLLQVGPQSVDSFRERAENLPADQPQLIHELHLVMAETGLAQVEEAIRAIDKLSGGFAYLSIWKAAHALRRDLVNDQSATPASTR